MKFQGKPSYDTLADYYATQVEKLYQNHAPDYLFSAQHQSKAAISQACKPLLKRVNVGTGMTSEQVDLELHRLFQKVARGRKGLVDPIPTKRKTNDCIVPYCIKVATESGYEETQTCFDHQKKKSKRGFGLEEQYARHRIVYGDLFQKD